jgi:hypothetical protein
MHTATEIHAAPSRYDAYKMIAANIAHAIKSGSGAVVEVTLIADGRYSICGTADDCEKAHEVLTLAGLTRNEIVHDAELGETFAYYAS